MNEFNRIFVLYFAIPIAISFTFIYPAVNNSFKHFQEPQQNWTCVETRNDTVCSASVSVYSKECDQWARYLGLKPDGIPMACAVGFQCDQGKDMFSRCMINSGRQQNCEIQTHCLKEGLNCKYGVACDHSLNCNIPATVCENYRDVSYTLAK